MPTPYDKILMALICPCGECALDPREWECKAELSAAQLKEADEAWKKFKEFHVDRLSRGQVQP